ncbi:adenosylcobinamide-phosphate synthase CbiB [Streptococcus ovuberis]|uniref:Cobalamin biosynthesis protein CobD n=1 Tax=Streptococcus ovuberis TaxID=1936207 RepID=A0A7X6N1C9_9STRE|nr:adenosylcobinamide-phosphate synthase CbiB [Streptococcus ovuberis]NKZ20392.1 cobalamin biosynthesis protein CobD [Streptococcus ovuberis]
MVVLAVILAVLLDWILGDPYHWPHPVKWMGNYISFCLRYRAKRPVTAYLFGGLLWVTTVGLTVGVVTAGLYLAQQVHVVLYWVVWIYLAYASLAGRSLAVEAVKVYRTLQEGSLEDARYQVSMIVGRDTTSLNREEIAKATIETVAENTSDGVIGPLLCLFLGGPVLAMGYKAVNTLDSMVGYRTEKYRYIGFVSAKMDDLANLLPARLTWGCLVLASHMLQLDGRSALRIGWRDRYQHASPNSAFSEAVVAGALGIRLGGAHVYHGELIDKPTIGDRLRAVVPQDILTTVSLLYMSTTVALLLGLLSYISLNMIGVI